MSPGKVLLDKEINVTCKSILNSIAGDTVVQGLMLSLWVGFISVHYLIVLSPSTSSRSHVKPEVSVDWGCLFVSQWDPVLNWQRFNEEAIWILEGRLVKSPLCHIQRPRDSWLHFSLTVSKTTNIQKMEGWSRLQPQNHHLLFSTVPEANCQDYCFFLLLFVSCFVYLILPQNVFLVNWCLVRLMQLSDDYLQRWA